MKRSWLGMVLAILCLILGTGLLAGGWLWWNWQPVAAASTTRQTFVVKRGETLAAIAQRLAAAHYIRSPWVFQAWVWQNGLAKKIQAGAYQLSPSLNLSELAQTLTKGTNDVWVTIKEGWRAEEVGEALAATLPEFDLDSPEFTSECKKYEGYLFPETYLLPLTYTTKQACARLRQEYGQKITMAMREDMHRAGHTEEQVIALASIVEREAKTPTDMKIVAGILWHRLELGMPLQVDATLQYAKGYNNEHQTWWAPPLAADKQIVSPYNTYLHAGLPPGPIGNPGLQAITAATYPTTSSYLFYISASDGSQLHYAETYSEHQANISRYLQ